METLGDRIKYLRISNKMTQEEIAQMLMVTKQAISSWERNVTSPDYKQLCFLADLFIVSVDYLLLRTDLRKPYLMPITEESTSPSSISSIESNETFSYDLQRILLTPSAPLHFGDYSLSMKDKQMLAKIINNIFERYHEFKS